MLLISSNIFFLRKIQIGLHFKTNINKGNFFLLSNNFLANQKNINRPVLFSLFNILNLSSVFQVRIN